MVDHLKLQGICSSQFVHGHFKRQDRLIVVTLKCSLDRELVKILLLNNLRVRLDLASLWELSGSWAHTSHFDIFEECVAGAVTVNSRKLDLLLVIAEEDLHTVGPSPFGDGDL